MKYYRWHPCGERHTTWADLGRCIWAHGTVAGDGPYAAASCGARDVVLYPTVDQAWARKRSLDRDGCRPNCYRRHHVIAIAPAQENGNPKAGDQRRAANAAKEAPKGRADDGHSMGPRCGRPRTNGQPCHRPAGWGADPGEKHCRDHGGSVKGRLAAKERLVESALTYARLAEKARTGVLTAEEERQLEAAVRAVPGARRGRRGSSAPEVRGSEGQWLGLLVALLLSGRTNGEVPDAR